jgi:ribosomal protein S12 methylthiotransferase
MLRPSNVDAQAAMFAEMRSAMPDMTFRSTFIVGFPGETEEEFSRLLSFIEQIEFDRVGAFTFSAEPGTPAFSLPDPVPAEVARERYERLMAAQQRISLTRNQMQVGRTLDILAEAVGELTGQKDAVTLARSYRDAPEVDGFVVVPDMLPIGEMATVRITGALEYDIMGERVP